MTAEAGLMLRRGGQQVDGRELENKLGLEGLRGMQVGPIECTFYWILMNFQPDAAAAAGAVWQTGPASRRSVALFEYQS